MARAQRRIGTPGMPFWRELTGIFIRYKYLLERAQVIQPIKVDGRAVSLLPRNPAQAAAQQQELAEAARAAQIMGAMFPEEFKANVDGRATIEAWFDMARVSVIKLRDKQAVAAAVEQMSKLLGGQQAGAPEQAVPGPAA
jgi:hypothetical protein